MGKYRKLAFQCVVLKGVFAAISLPACIASAGSIDPIVGHGVKSTSLVTIACTACPPLKSREKIRGYRVEDLAPPTQRVEISQVHNEMKMVRTEAWMGGSPVVFGSNLSGKTANALSHGKDDLAVNDAILPNGQPSVDLLTTSAVTATMQQPEAGKPASRMTEEPARSVLGPDGLKLRLN